MTNGQFWNIAAGICTDSFIGLGLQSFSKPNFLMDEVDVKLLDFAPISVR